MGLKRFYIRKHRMIYSRRGCVSPLAFAGGYGLGSDYLRLVGCWLIDHIVRNRKP